MQSIYLRFEELGEHVHVAFAVGGVAKRNKFEKFRQVSVESVVIALQNKHRWLLRSSCIRLFVVGQNTDAVRECIMNIFAACSSGYECRMGAIPCLIAFVSSVLSSEDHVARKRMGKCPCVLIV